MASYFWAFSGSVPRPADVGFRRLTISNGASATLLKYYIFQKRLFFKQRSSRYGRLARLGSRHLLSYESPPRVEKRPYNNKSDTCPHYSCDTGAENKFWCKRVSHVFQRGVYNLLMSFLASPKMRQVLSFLVKKVSVPACTHDKQKRGDR